MRITQRAVTLTSLQGLNRNLESFTKLQEQLTSGKMLSAPSDSPTGTNRAMQTRAEQDANAQYARNISDGQSWLNQTDSTLQQMLNVARRVRDLTVQKAVRALNMRGYADDPIRGLRLRDVDFGTVSRPDILEYVEGVELKKVRENGKPMTFSG